MVVSAVEANVRIREPSSQEVPHEVPCYAVGWREPGQYGERLDRTMCGQASLSVDHVVGCRMLLVPRGEGGDDDAGIG